MSSLGEKSSRQFQLDSRLTADERSAGRRKVVPGAIVSGGMRVPSRVAGFEEQILLYLSVESGGHRRKARQAGGRQGGRRPLTGGRSRLVRRADGILGGAPGADRASRIRVPRTIPMFSLMISRRTDGRVRASRFRASLADLRESEDGILDRIDLDPDQTQQLMELGFIPGTRVTAGRAAPGGDPRVYRVDGAEVALRRETARRLWLRYDNSSPTRP